MNTMNTTMRAEKINYSYFAFFVASFMLLAGIVSMATPVNAATFTQLTAQLDYGQTSANVTNLQIFLGSSPTIYPQGKVTGYFGPLTKSAVMNFQNAYGLSQVGRVGPQTLAKINNLIASGTPLSGSGPITYTGNTIAPTIFTNSITVGTSSNSVNIGWSTNEATKAMVYYSVAPFVLNEATTEFSRPTILGGSVTSLSASFQNSQSVTVSNLLPHTTYYYMIEASDTDGNFSYVMPSTFTTNY